MFTTSIKSTIALNYCATNIKIHQIHDLQNTLKYCVNHRDFWKSINGFCLFLFYVVLCFGQKHLMWNPQSYCNIINNYFRFKIQLFLCFFFMVIIFFYGIISINFWYESCNELWIFNNIFLTVNNCVKVWCPSVHSSVISSIVSRLMEY